MPRGDAIGSVLGDGVRSPAASNAATDSDGRFEIEVAEGRIGSVELRLGVGFRESLPILVREGAGIPADGDLGDVVVDGVRHVPFLLHETSGAPIEVTSAAVPVVVEAGREAEVRLALPPGTRRAP